MEEPQVYDDDLGTWLQTELGIPRKALKAFNEADDWTAVIVMHAIAESVLNKLIVSRLGEELEDFVANLTVGNRSTGKLTCCEVLGLLPKHRINFIAALSGIRNKIAHYVENYEFTYETWFERHPGAFDSMRDSLKPAFTQIQLKGVQSTVEQALRIDPHGTIRSAFWFMLEDARKTIEALQHQSVPKIEQSPSPQTQDQSP